SPEPTRLEKSGRSCEPLSSLGHDDPRGVTAVPQGISCHCVEAVVEASRKPIGVPIHGARTRVAGAAHGAKKPAVAVNLYCAQPYAACRLHCDLCRVSKLGAI